MEGDQDRGAVGGEAEEAGQLVERGPPPPAELVHGLAAAIRAEVPMAELLSYAPDLRALTGGQGDYTMELARYEEVPAHLAQKVVAAQGEQEVAVKA